ncbi:unnamed protein product [Lampetra fluviatilis]
MRSEHLYERKRERRERCAAACKMDGSLRVRINPPPAPRCHHNPALSGAARRRRCCSARKTTHRASAPRSRKLGQEPRARRRPWSSITRQHEQDNAQAFCRARPQWRSGLARRREAAGPRGQGGELAVRTASSALTLPLLSLPHLEERGDELETREPLEPELESGVWWERGCERDAVKGGRGEMGAAAGDITRTTPSPRPRTAS